MNELISIIIVNYNGKKWLEKLFNSLFSQTYQNFEIIIVDNNSTDDSVSFLNSNYSDNRLKIIKNTNNNGFAGGNNLGIKNATGKFVLLLNNDTWIDDDFLEKIYNFYTSNNFDVIAPFENNYDNKGNKIYNTKIDPLGHPIYNYNNKYNNNFYLSGVCLFFRKDLYFETMELDNNFFMYFEEIDWFWRLNLLKKQFKYIPDLYIHHVGSGSTGNGIKYNSFLWRNQNCLQMLLKNYKWFNLLWILPIYFLQNIFEMIFFLIILKPKIAFSYIEGWLFNVKNIKKILEKRKLVQKNRQIGDFEIFKKMYIGFGKLHHLINFIKQNGRKKSL